MGDLLLLGSVAVLFLLGFFVMAKLDRFLEENRKAQEAEPPSGEERLRVGFADPLAAEGLSGLLEEYSRRFPGAAVSLFGASEEELLGQLSRGKADIIFLPDGVGEPSRARYGGRRISLRRGAAILKDSGLLLEPGVEERRKLRALWRKSTETRPAVRRFLDCLPEEPEEQPPEGGKPAAPML